MITVEDISHSDETVTVVPPRVVTKLSIPTSSSVQFGVDGVVGTVVGGGVTPIGAGVTAASTKRTWKQGRCVLHGEGGGLGGGGGIARERALTLN